MISVVIPTLDAAATLPRCLNGLLDAAMSGIVREVIIVDGGSRDDTLSIADAAGARIVSCTGPRGACLAEGAAAARSDWLLFLHADTVLEPAWVDDALTYMERSEPDAPGAAAFGFALDDFTPSARRREHLAALRSWLLGLPYGDQGLLLPARFYRALGGFRPLSRMEDIDLVRRIGRRRLTMLRARAVTIPAGGRSRARGRGGLQRLGLLVLHALRVPVPIMARFYG